MMTATRKIQSERHGLAGCYVVLVSHDAPVTPMLVHDWLIREPGDMPTALASQAALRAMWDGKEEWLIYGHIGSLGVIVHPSEIGYVVNPAPDARRLVEDWEAS